jgi:hypothetical protein
MTNTDETTVAVSDPAAATPRFRNGGAMHFLRHLVEMALAMIVGMLLLGPVWEAISTRLAASDVLTRPDVSALVMATNMTAGMSVWMRHRGHSSVAIVEMGAAMYLPFLLVLVPFWAGALPGAVVPHAGHMLMVAAMVLAMLRRRDEYTQPHRSHK